MLPYADDPRVRSRRFPIVNILIILANIAVFLHELTLNDTQINQFVDKYGFTPNQFWHGHQPYTVVTAIFLHAGLLHIAGNMLFLWIFGDNVEDQLGHVTYLAFYLVGGVAASVVYAFVFSGSSDPLVGASGAIAAVLGGYILLYPRSIVQSILIFGPFLAVGGVAAAILIGVWFLMQVAYSASSINVLDTGTQSNVAFMAHVGGFAFGLIVTWLIRRERGQDVVHWDQRQWFNRSFRNWVLLIVVLSLLAGVGQYEVSQGALSAGAFHAGLGALVVVIAIVDGVARLRGLPGLLGSAGASRLLAILQIIAAISVAGTLIAI